MGNKRKILDKTLCLGCGKPIIEHHRTNRKKYHQPCKRVADRLSNLASQRLRRAGIWVSEPDKGITIALQKILGL